MYTLYTLYSSDICALSNSNTESNILLENFISNYTDVNKIRTTSVQNEFDSNLVDINKKIHNISNISKHDLINLVNQTTTKEELDALNSSSRVRSLMQFSIPEGKLFYPEPFIASPSYLHSDLAFLHILHYWYWLWFLFIFLICFFFLSFVCTVRWCQTRLRPRKETRGVSRSKCGDLITATVPVSWALSIIVQETTDATDLNDGFGTGELVIGVRAYQWGWEYYYPKTIDLNYNVKSSYSSFVGNSVKYNYANHKHQTSNTFWRLYQNKIGDSVNVPAHTLLTPMDNSNTLNLISFKNLGLNNSIKLSLVFSDRSSIWNFNFWSGAANLVFSISLNSSPVPSNLSLPKLVITLAIISLLF